ncbi:hypothetical protein HDU76_008888 [Blyttiomyces sp. JEL0837]|nr:hypothetical protein HDU76_008888 [Blyttiomyces sp. JEL0837]
MSPVARSPQKTVSSSQTTSKSTSPTAQLNAGVNVGASGNNSLLVLPGSPSSSHGSSSVYEVKTFQMGLDDISSEPELESSTIVDHGIFDDHIPMESSKRNPQYAESPQSGEGYEGSGSRSMAHSPARLDEESTRADAEEYSQIVAEFTAEFRSNYRHKLGRVQQDTQGQENPALFERKQPLSLQTTHQIPQIQSPQRLMPPNQRTYAETPQRNVQSSEQKGNSIPEQRIQTDAINNSLQDSVMTEEELTLMNAATQGYARVQRSPPPRHPPISSIDENPSLFDYNFSRSLSDGQTAARRYHDVRDVRTIIPPANVPTPELNATSSTVWMDDYSRNNVLDPATAERPTSANYNAGALKGAVSNEHLVITGATPQSVSAVSSPLITSKWSPPAIMPDIDGRRINDGIRGSPVGDGSRLVRTPVQLDPSAEFRASGAMSQVSQSQGSVRSPRSFDRSSFEPMTTELDFYKSALRSSQMDMQKLQHEMNSIRTELKRAQDTAIPSSEMTLGGEPVNFHAILKETDERHAQTVDILRKQSTEEVWNMRFAITKAFLMNFKTAKENEIRRLLNVLEQSTQEKSELSDLLLIEKAKNARNEDEFRLFGRKLRSLQDGNTQLRNENENLRAELRKYQYEGSSAAESSDYFRDKLEQVLYDNQSLRSFAGELSRQNDALHAELQRIRAGGGAVSATDSRLDDSSVSPRSPAFSNRRSSGQTGTGEEVLDRRSPGAEYALRGRRESFTEKMKRYEEDDFSPVMTGLNSVPAGYQSVNERYMQPSPSSARYLPMDSMSKLQQMTGGLNISTSENSQGGDILGRSASENGGRQRGSWQSDSRPTTAGGGGGGGGGNGDAPIDYLSLQTDMDRQLRLLNDRKAALMSELQRIPLSGRGASSRKRKDEIDNQLDQVEKEIGAIKMKMRTFNML